MPDSEIINQTSSTVDLFPRPKISAGLLEAATHSPLEARPFGPTCADIVLPPFWPSALGSPLSAHSGHYRTIRAGVLSAACFSFSHESKAQRRAAADNSGANCQRESSSLFAARRKRRAGHELRRPKITPGQNAKIPERQCDMSDVSDPAAGQFEERKPSARESGERGAKGGEPIRGSHSGIANPAPSPQPPKKTWRVGTKLGEFEKTREFSTTTTWRVREKPRVKRQESRANPVTGHRSPIPRLNQNNPVHRHAST